MKKKVPQIAKLMAPELKQLEHVLMGTDQSQVQNIKTAAVPEATHSTSAPSGIETGAAVGFNVEASMISSPQIESLVLEGTQEPGNNADPAALKDQADRPGMVSLEEIGLKLKGLFSPTPSEAARAEVARDGLNA